MSSYINMWTLKIATVSQCMSLSCVLLLCNVLCADFNIWWYWHWRTRVKGATPLLSGVRWWMKKGVTVGWMTVWTSGYLFSIVSVPEQVGKENQVGTGWHGFTWKLASHVGLGLWVSVKWVSDDLMKRWNQNRPSSFPGGMSWVSTLVFYGRPM